MHARKMSRSTLFLLELTLAVLILGLCSAACVRLFVTAKYVTEETRSQDEMAYLASGVAERVLAAAPSEDPMEGFPDAIQEDGEYVFYYGQDWEALSSRNADGAEAYHELHVSVWEEEGFRHASFVQCEKSHGYVPEELFTVKKYMEGRAG